MSLRLIAQSLGLSITTVSRALSDYSDVAEDTKRRVLEEAARIGYVPNALARRLQKGRADSIALATRIDNLGNTDTLLYEVVAATWSRLVELQLDTVLLGIGLDPERDISEKGAFKRTVRERTVDGIILVRPTVDDWRISFLEKTGFLFVVLGTVSQPCAAPVIGPDIEAGARLLTERFAALGHHRVACIAPLGGYQFVAAHMAALTARGSSRGLTFSLFEGPASEAGGFAQTRAALSQPDRPTAFLYLFNRMAHGGASALCECGLEPGRDTAVISFGDDHLLPHTRPPMTALNWPVHDMARHAVDVLTRIIGRQPLDLVSSWPVELVLRSSDCRVPNAA